MTNNDVGWSSEELGGFVSLVLKPFESYLKTYFSEEEKVMHTNHPDDVIVPHQSL